MNRIALVMALLILSSFCAEKEQKVDIIIENGVEVVLNHLEPYILKEQPSSFTLEQEFVIDFEQDDLARLGTGELRGFEVDSVGNIYCLSENQIFLFDNKGEFVRKFGTEGQGPGEFVYPMKWQMTDKDEFALYDRVTNKFVYFNAAGDLTAETKIPSTVKTQGMVSVVLPGERGYLCEDIMIDREVESSDLHLTLLNKDFDITAKLPEKVNRINPFKSARVNLFTLFLKYQVCGDKIYSASQENPEFLINIYDFQGNNLRRITKEYHKIKIPAEYKKTRMEDYLNSTPYRVHKMQGYFMDSYPAIKNLYLAPLGRIFVETYEKGESQDEEMIDVFNTEGAYIGRVSLKKALFRKFSIDRMYASYEKESGYHEIKVSKMSWQ